MSVYDGSISVGNLDSGIGSNTSAGPEMSPRVVSPIVSDSVASEGHSETAGINLTHSEIVCNYII